MTRTRITNSALVAAVAILTIHTAAPGNANDDPTSDAKVRLGAFDSRAVATAYYRSETFAELLADLHAKRDKAKAAGKTELAEKLEARGRTWQDLAHKQGFAARPIGRILNEIRGELPKIAQTAEVDIIVSKWDLTYQRPGTKLVDVTDHMVRLFDPDEETLKVIQDLRKKEPVSATKLPRDE